MGWTRKRTGRNGQVTYQGLYRDLHGDRHSVGTFATQRAAQRAADRAETDAAAGRLGDPRRGRQTLVHYVETEWFPNHVIEASTRETYRNRLDLYIIPILGTKRLARITSNDLREWIVTLQGAEYGASPATVVKCKTIIDAVFSTAFNDKIIPIHPGRGVKTPPVPRRPRRIITAEQFELIYQSIPEGNDNGMRLLLEVDIESGARWGELTELRPRDLDIPTRTLTISRVVVELTSKGRPSDERFIVKQYPKDREWRAFKLSQHLIEKVIHHIDTNDLGSDDLLFRMPASCTSRRTLPEQLPDPELLGWTEPNDKGRTYRHGTTSAYGPGKCRCRHCKNAVAAYRAQRRAAGKDQPRKPRAVHTDGHISRGWFRNQVWLKALEKAKLGFHVTPHGLRHAHASWLLAGGANLQVVKERLGHASIATTERYLHTLPNADETAIDALSSIRRPVQKATHTDQFGLERQAEVSELEALRETVAKVKKLHESLGLVI